MLSYRKQLPRPLTPRADGARVTICVDDDLPAARADDALAALTLRLRIMEMTGRDRVTVRVNGRPVPDALVRVRGSSWDRRLTNVPYTYAAPPWREDASGAWQWVFCDLTNSDHLVQGVNAIEVILTEKNPEVLAPLVLYNVEIDVKYRRGPDEGNLGTGRF